MFSVRRQLISNRRWKTRRLHFFTRL